MIIHKATSDDLDAIKKIADANRDTLGFVMRPALTMAMQKHWLMVTERDSEIVGFVNYRHRRDSQTTIYEICVAKDYRGQGIGHMLIDAVQREAISQGKAYIQLKAVIEIAANGFYEHLGFALVGVETGKKRALNVWRYDVRPHLLFGRNPLLVDIARDAGWQLGIRSDASPMRYPPMFVDIDYKKPDFERHLEVVARYRPRYATVTDLSETIVSKEDIARAIQQAERLQPYCEIVLIVPKLSGQIDLLPPSIAIGYSVPSRYGGAQYPLWELEGRRVHLLGGSPRKQMQAYHHLSAISTVISADGNYAQSQAVKFAMYWHKHQWHYHPEKGSGGKDLYAQCWQWSCENLLREWKRIS